jgi:hypothetical protein
LGITGRFVSVREKLSTNKVNKNNAFEMRIANYIEEIFIGIGADYSKESMWQKYSAGVDSTTSIYGYCVDHVYSETYKMSKTLSRKEVG